MEHPTSLWEDISFASKGDMTCGAVGWANCLTSILHHTSAVLSVLMEEAINAALVTDSEVELLVTFADEDAGIDYVQVWKTIYLLSPYVGMFLEQDITPVKAWRRLQGGIVDAGAKAGCLPIIDWLRVALAWKNGGNQLSPLTMTRPTAPPMDTELLCHRHQILICHLPGHDRVLHHVQGFITALCIREVDIDLRRYREKNARVIEQSKNKGVPYFMGNNLTFLLRLSHIYEHESLPPVWKALASATKYHQLTCLQWEFNNAARWLGACAPIVVTPGLFKMILALSFCLEHRDDLGTGIHMFFLGQHTSDSRKLLKDHIDQP